jgi:hypothetical protein
MIARRWSAYSSMMRRASSERDSLGGGSTSSKRGLLDGFMPQRSDRRPGKVMIQINAAARLPPKMAHGT